MMDVHPLVEVFTPTTPARLTFVERHDINNRIVRALQTPGTQVIVYGPSGSGKTTLLENKLSQVYEKHLKTCCMKNMSFESVMLDAFDQLSMFYDSEHTDEHSSRVDASVRASFQLIDSQIKAGSSRSRTKKTQRILPPQLTPQNLARFLGAAGYCWIMDDFHKIKGEDKQALSQLMKVFVDMSIEFPDLKIICVGAVDTARQVVQYDAEMKDRVAEIRVPLMEAREIEQIVTKGFELLNVEIVDEMLCEDIFYYCNGVPAICHKLCLLMCDSLGINETIITESGGPSGETVGSANLGRAVGEYLDDASDTIRRSFDKAFRVSNSQIVLEALSECGEDGESAQGVVEVVSSLGWALDAAEVISILDKLQREPNGDIVRFNAVSKVYNFASPFLLTFARTLFEHSSYRHNMSQGDLLKMMNKAFATMRREYSEDEERFQLRPEP